MYPLIKILGKDLVNEIYHYNNYTDLDLEWFKYEHQNKYYEVLFDLQHFFLRPKLIKLFEDYWSNYQPSL